MMNKVRTAKVHLLRFFFVLPLAAVLLLAFRSGMGQNPPDSIPRHGQELVSSADTTQPVEFGEFKKRNPSVQSVSWMSHPSRIVIRLKNGDKEVYNLENEAEKAKVVQKYGGLPEAPPPPPAPPGPPSSSREPAPPTLVVDEVPPTAPGAPTPPVAPEKVSVAAPPIPAVPPTPPAPPDTIILEADEITISNGQIKLRGSVEMRDNGSEAVEVRGTSFNLQSGTVVMIDGKEPEQGKTYSGRFEVTRLSGDEAIRKYGDKARSGAVELRKIGGR